MTLIQQVLLTFVGNRDPFDVDRQGQSSPGPVLTLLAGKPFNEVVLIHTKNMRGKAETLTGEIANCFPEVVARREEIPISDPTSYGQILKELRVVFQKVTDRRNYAEFFLCVSSGTPTMHASMLLLAASGEIPTKILHIKEPRFLKDGESLIREIDPRSSEFPIILSKPVLDEVPEDLKEEDIASALAASGIVGDAPALRKVLDTAARVATSDASVVITGESGTGKELLARFIHRVSKRRNHPFLAVNCGAIPSELVESELFGHAKGAFTGAVGKKLGQFQLADGGTLFLDEIGDLPLAAQVKFLRVLQTGQITPVGEERSTLVNVRIVAATHRDLTQEMKQARFREDLYFRLAVIQLHLPPLAGRRSDIPKIALHIVNKFNSEYGKNKSLSPISMEHLKRYDWPGNIRELENVLHRTLLISRKAEIGPEELLFGKSLGRENALPPSIGEGFSVEDYLDSLRKEIFWLALKQANGNQSEASRLLGISNQAVSKFVQRNGTSKPETEN